MPPLIMLSATPEMSLVRIIMTSGTTESRTIRRTDIVSLQISAMKFRIDSAIMYLIMYLAHNLTSTFNIIKVEDKH